MSFSVSAIFPCEPVNYTGIRTLKSPFFMDVSVRSKMQISDQWMRAVFEGYQISKIAALFISREALWR